MYVWIFIIFAPLLFLQFKTEPPRYLAVYQHGMRILTLMTSRDHTAWTWDRNDGVRSSRDNSQRTAKKEEAEYAAIEKEKQEDYTADNEGRKCKLEVDIAQLILQMM